MAKEGDGRIRVDPKTGFCPETKTFVSLRPAAPLPPPDLPLSVAAHALSLYKSAAASGVASPCALIDSDTGARLSYAEFFARAECLTASLKKRYPWARTGSCVAFILAISSFDLPVLYFSLLSLGVAVSPSSPLSTAPEISRQIRLVKPVVAFAISATARLLPPNFPVILLDSPEFAAMTRDGGDGASRNSRPAEDVPQSLPAAVLYSSGTTGRVKGVEITHRNLIATLTVHEGIKGGAVTSPAVYLVTVPLFHAYGFGVWLCALAKGETLVLMSRFDMGKALSAVERFKVTKFPAAPPVVSALARDPTVDRYDLSSLELVISGGAPLSTDAMRRFVTRFPHVHLSQGLGMTENPVAIGMAVDPEECQRLGPVGRLSSNHEAKIVDPDSGEALPPGRRGELWVRGPAVMKGYIGDEAATAKALGKDGWLRTGDLCYFDDEGFLFVVDRLKELIKYKGYQVAPAELEDLLLTHPEIVEAAVIPYPDEEAGQIPMACVVRHPKARLDEGQVKDYVASKVAPYKKIRRVVFVDSIPKNPTGKILRKDLIKVASSSASPSKL